jgi:hypothetical protein
MLVCVSLETARRLKDAGYRHETATWWVKRRDWVLTTTDDLAYREEAIAAPTGWELLRDLPMRRCMQLGRFSAETGAEMWLEREGGL